MRLRRVVAALACLVAALPAAALVLTTITVDGSMDDWNSVLGDPLQNAWDGPAAGLVDRDGAVNDPTHDLTRFAWTYDDSEFFVYIERDQAHSGRERVWIYLDTDADGLMELSDPVIQIDWWGNSRKTQVTVRSYLPASASGDPLGDASGLADGWTMPGSLTDGVLLTEAAGGNRDRRRMEEAIPWSVLGIAPGTLMMFHISSSSGVQIPGDIEDNMGGPGGVIGVTGVTEPTVTLVKSVSAALAAPGDLLTYSVNWLNSGSATAYEVVLVDPVPVPTVYEPGTASGPGATIEFSHDGGGTWDTSEAAPVTHIRFRFAAPLPPGASGSVAFQARIP